MAEEGEQSYSKRNYFSPKNIIIYIVVAIVVYGAAYSLFLNKNSGYKAPANTSTTTETQVGNDNTTMSVALEAQNDSGQPGTVTLTEVDGKTTVSLSLDAPSSVPQPAHIHAGACPTPGEVVYPLTNVVDGSSETVLDVDLATIKSQLPLVVNVHKSETESGVYVACGDLQ